MLAIKILSAYKKWIKGSCLRLKCQFRHFWLSRAAARGLVSQQLDANSLAHQIIITTILIIIIIIIVLTDHLRMTTNHEPDYDGNDSLLKMSIWDALCAAKKCSAFTYFSEILLSGGVWVLNKHCLWWWWHQSKVCKQVRQASQLFPIGKHF